MIWVQKLENEYWLVERHLYSYMSKKTAALQGITHFHRNDYIEKRSESFFTLKLFTRWHCNQIGVSYIGERNLEHLKWLLL